MILADAVLNAPALTVPVTVRLPASILFDTLKFCTPLMVVMFALVALKVPALTVPVAGWYERRVVNDTCRLVSVPTFVMIGWFAVVIVPLKVAAVILFATVRF